MRLAFTRRGFAGFGSTDAQDLQVAKAAGYHGDDVAGARSWYKAMFGATLGTPESSAPGAASNPVNTQTKVVNCAGYPCLAHEHVAIYAGHCVCEPDPGTQTQAGPQDYARPPPPPPPFSSGAASDLISITGQKVSSDVAAVANDTPGLNKWWIAAAALGLAAAVVIYAGRK